MSPVSDLAFDALDDAGDETINEFISLEKCLTTVEGEAFGALLKKIDLFLIDLMKVH